MSSPTTALSSTESIAQNPYLDTPENALVKACFRVAARMPVAAITTRAAHGIVADVAPTFRYQGSRVDFRRSRLRYISRNLYRRVHSDEWQEPTPSKHDPDFIERQRKAARCKAGYVGAKACARHVIMRAYIQQEGYSRDEVSLLFNVCDRTVRRALTCSHCAENVGHVPTSTPHDREACDEEIQINEEIQSQKRVS